MAKHKTKDKDRETISRPQKKSLKAKYEQKKEEEFGVLGRCKVWLKEQKKEKFKTPVVSDNFSCDLSDNDDELANAPLEQFMDVSSPSITSETSKKSNKESTKIEYDVKILFACEWQKCCAMLKTYSCLIEHIQGHLKSISLDDNIAEDIDQFHACEWDLCNFNTNDKQTLIRHVLYHGYHTHLKTLGEQLLEKKDPLPPCMNDSVRRNLIPATDSIYVCMWRKCKYKLEAVHEYFDHARNHCIHELATHKVRNRNMTVQCKWIDCDKKFNKRLKMIDHMRTHTGERMLACPNCGSTFNSYTKFYDHFRRQSITTNFKCSECFQSFATEELLNNHMYGHINCVKCTMCDMTCPSQAALAQHFRYRHLKERPFKCLQCDYAAVTKWDLNKHILNRHIVEPTTFYCEGFDCDFSCTKVSIMRKHERNEHGNGPNIYCCHLCNKHYQYGWSLSKHLIKKHGFQLPSGHRRFTYRQNIDGFYRVQTTRIESLEVSEQIISKSKASVSMSDDVSYELDKIKKNKSGFTINLVEKQQIGSKRIENVSTKKDLVDLEADFNSTVVSVADGKEHVDIGDIDSNEGVFEKPDAQKDMINIADLIADSCDLLREDSIDGSVQSEPIFSSRFHINSNDQFTENSASEIVDVIPVASGSDNNDIEPIIKNINDFSVMKKYLKKSTRANEILITFNEIDEQGNVIHTKTRKATEIEVTNFKDLNSNSTSK